LQEYITNKDFTTMKPNQVTDQHGNIIIVSTVESGQSKRNEVKALPSDSALELKEIKIPPSDSVFELNQAKSEILRLKQELRDRRIKVSDSSQSIIAILRNEIWAVKDLLEKEKENSKSTLSSYVREHCEEISRINEEHRKALDKAVLKAITAPINEPTIRDSCEEGPDDDSVDELDRQYDRDNGFLDPAPYDVERGW
jgi:hypothetical protein